MLSACLSEINNKIKEIEKSKIFLANQYETFRNQVGCLKAENVQLVARIRNLEKMDKQRAKAVDELEQYARSNMVEVIGIPRRAKENCKELVLELPSKIDVELKAENIEAYHRILPKQDVPIMVKVVSRHLAGRKSSIFHKKFDFLFSIISFRPISELSENVLV